ncbi:FkbM family methyltransferase [Variibacter gotjawalensis]|nr:FkbM family methyltransferase [Variibacter gotjawalensis]NIK47885.1 FkbM family methyltransferase [Variibacter gotjawalensis]
METKAGAEGTDNAISMAPSAMAGPRRLRRFARLILGRLSRPFMTRLRAYMTVETNLRLSVLQQRLEATQDAARVAQAQANQALQQLHHLFVEVANTQSRALELQQHTLRDVGYLHLKSDEFSRKTRPVIKLGDAFAVPLADGYIFIPEQEEALLLMYTGATAAGLEPGTRAVLQAVAPIGGRAIDVGANVGLHTLALATSVGAAGKVHAFEPEPRLIPFLTRTLAVNGLAFRVEIVSSALGAANCIAKFDVAKTIGHSSLINLSAREAVTETIEVEVKRLDDVFHDAEADVIKIDVEGAELDVILGGRKLIERSPNCAIVAEFGLSHLTRSGLKIEHWLQTFTSLGLVGFAIEEPSGKLREFDHDWLAEQHSVNLVFFRPGSRPEQRLQRAQLYGASEAI